MWKVYYDDGTVMNSAQVPDSRRGVIVIAQAEERVGREILSGNDWYYLRNGHWYGADDFGIMDQILYHLSEITCVLQGRMTDRETFNAMVIRACDDPGLPRKSARQKTEKLNY